MIPKELREFETFVVAYSAGQDSSAVLCWALKNLPRERIRVVFCNTGVAWPETYAHLNYIEERLDITIDRIRAGDRPYPPKRNGHARVPVAYGTSFFDMVRIRGEWPNFNVRFCSIFLKMWPMKLYARSYPHVVVLEGSRREESRARAKKTRFDPSGDKSGIPVYRPVIDWSKKKVQDFLIANKIKRNPVYNYATRCGCWCCVLGRNSETFNFCQLYPDIAQEAADLEREIGVSWKANRSIANVLDQARRQMLLFPDERFSAVD